MKCISLGNQKPQGDEHIHRKGLEDPSYLMDHRGRPKKGLSGLEKALPQRRMTLEEWKAVYDTVSLALEEQGLFTDTETPDRAMGALLKIEPLLEAAGLL